MAAESIQLERDASRTPHGVRGLKLRLLRGHILGGNGRTPHGVRGLKSHAHGAGGERNKSHPSRGAWIEMALASAEGLPAVVAPLTGCVD